MKKYSLSITKPCGENWDSMESSGGGKFCLNCAKHVLDFTNMTDQEILNVIENNTGRICGRIRKSQLLRPLLISRPVNSINLYPRIMATLLLLGQNTEASAQQTGNPAPVENNQSKESRVIPTANKRHQASDSSHYFKGTILDAKTKEPIQYAVVILKGTKLGCQADTNGHFSLFIPAGSATDPFTLTVNYVGYEPVQLEVSKKNINTLTPIFLEESEPVLMGDVIYMPEPKKKKKKER